MKNVDMPLLNYPGTRGSLMQAAEIARALHGRRAGRGWKARCPAHEDHTPSLSITAGNDGRVLVHCHAGCDQTAVIDALRAQGLWHTDDQRPRLHVVRAASKCDDDASRIDYARAIWKAGTDPRGTIAETYLASRKLLLPEELCGHVLRFHAACPWEGNIIPCLIAAFRSVADDSVRAIHRVRLDQSERWPKTQRMMIGPVAGSAVKLDPAGDRLVVGEGVETCLAARQLGFAPVWALGSSSNIKTLSPIAGVEAVTVLGERDNGSNLNAARECCNRWKPRRVYLAAPPPGFKDFNDFLMERKNVA